MRGTFGPKWSTFVPIFCRNGQILAPKMICFSEKVAQELKKDRHYNTPGFFGDWQEKKDYEKKRVKKK